MQRNKYKLFLVLCICLLFMGCNDPNTRIGYLLVIPNDQRSVAAQWITDTATAANPKSDEEPEDMLFRLEQIALTLFGKPTVGLYIDHIFVPYEHLGNYHQQVCDDWVKGQE